MLGMDVGVAFAGALFIEQIFQLPGMGELLVQSLAAADLPMILGIVLVVSVVVVFVNLIVDLLYLLDRSASPRWRQQGRQHDCFVDSRGELLRAAARGDRACRLSPSGELRLTAWPGPAPSSRAGCSRRSGRPTTATRTLLSFGQDPRWRRFLVSRLPVGPDDTVLDVACGTAAVVARARAAEGLLGRRRRPERARCSPRRGGGSRSRPRRSACGWSRPPPRSCPSRTRPSTA